MWRQPLAEQYPDPNLSLTSTLSLPSTLTLTLTLTLILTLTLTLIHAGGESGDPVWRQPLAEQYPNPIPDLNPNPSRAIP